MSYIVIGEWFQKTRFRFSGSGFSSKYGIWATVQRRLIPIEPENAKEACDRSLKCLAVDYIDSYYQHRVDKTTLSVPWPNWSRRRADRGFLTGVYKTIDDYKMATTLTKLLGFSILLPQSLVLRRHTQANSLWLAVVLQAGIPIPGTIEIEKLEENFRAPDVEITEDEAKYIREAVIAANVIGER
ncbi:NADP-dependent oxidoreductase domain-containing protein [Lipomyces mesembrius]